MHENGTAASEQRQERGWFRCGDGAWRAWDGFDADPVLEVRAAPRVSPPELEAYLHALLDQAAPPVRVVA